LWPNPTAGIVNGMREDGPINLDDLMWAAVAATGLLPPTPQPSEVAVLRAARDRPEDGAAWAALTGWLADNGHQDEADAVRAFWPAIADSLYMGMPLTRAMSLLGRHAAGLAKLARRLGAAS
jgi:hypothetical protein